MINSLKRLFQKTIAFYVGFPIYTPYNLCRMLFKTLIRCDHKERLGTKLVLLFFVCVSDSPALVVSMLNIRHLMQPIIISK